MRTRPSTTALWVAGYVVASLLLLLAGGTEPVRTARQMGAALLDPPRQVVAAAGGTVADAVRAIGEIDRLRAENEELRRRLSGAEQRIAEMREAARENAELRELLGIGAALDMELLPVRVTTRDPSNFARELRVDAGTDDGVRVGMPVVAAATGAGALVGTVVEADAVSARVRLIVDTRSVVAALDQRTRALGEIRGQAGGQLLLANVPVTEELATGDVVVTAGIRVGDDASAYPGGLLIGQIQAVAVDENAVTQTGFVRPALDASDLERLLIVLRFEQE